MRHPAPASPWRSAKGQVAAGQVQAGQGCQGRQVSHLQWGARVVNNNNWVQARHAQAAQLRRRRWRKVVAGMQHKGAVQDQGQVLHRGR